MNQQQHKYSLRMDNSLSHQKRGWGLNYYYWPYFLLLYEHQVQILMIIITKLNASTERRLC